MYIILDDGMVSQKDVDTIDEAIEICEDLVAHMEDARDFPVEFVIKNQSTGAVEARLLWEITMNRYDT